MENENNTNYNLISQAEQTNETDSKILLFPRREDDIIVIYRIKDGVAKEVARLLLPRKGSWLTEDLPFINKIIDAYKEWSPDSFV